MTQTLVLTFFIGFFLLKGAVAQENACESVTSTPVINALRLQNFTCTPQALNDCSYTQCSGTLAGYSRPVLILLPQNIDTLQLHFRGHKLNVFPEYDQDLPGMVKAFGIQNSICKNKTAVVIPESRGACKDYDLEFTTDKTFQDFVVGIHSATGNNFKNFPLKISAHSGGGRVLGRMLSSSVEVDSVSLFDGIYSDKTRNELKVWYQKNKKPLMISTVTSGSPYQYSQKLMQDLGVNALVSSVTIKNTPYQQIKQDKLLFLSREEGQVGALKAHYDLLSQTWNITQ
jgi:hypothetical protein